MNWRNFVKDHEGSYPVPRIKNNSGLWKKKQFKGWIIG